MNDTNQPPSMDEGSPYFTAQFKNSVNRITDDTIDLIFSIPAEKWGSFIRTVGRADGVTPPKRGEEVAIARAP